MKSKQIIEKIEAKLKAIDPAKRTTFLVFQFNFNKEDGTLYKSFVLDLKETKIYEGEAENPDGVITVGDEEFYLWATKEASYEDLLAKGKAKISGNLEAVKKLMAKFHE